MTDNNSISPAQVLLVEDNIDDVELTLEALKDSKVRMDVHVVSDGIAAMKFLRRQGEYANKPRPDLILLDLNLPLMDGREVLKTVRNDPDLTDLPVVVLTTSQSEEDVCKAYKLHANCYISKPVDFKQFSEIVKQIEGFWFQLVKLPRRSE
ncbi:MAG: response regulator [Proteobacteria bacterium]|nr:response regulator [Pseudomonadota bacterium]MBU1387179.1 response regulator [Pseudomonadota bacterium]MBU1541503.1 response regulator [Pseudomonadota bacterium]MBU2430175.1 response regulator [Pseudomonadota bacterium]MBU2482134.1 response regulator [Pseudomonadota bacterium]